jgi:hypothetical protein
MDRARIKGAIYHYGTRARIPSGLLRRACDGLDIAADYADYRTRRQLARAAVGDGRFAGFVRRERAFRLLAPGELPVVDRLATMGREILDRRTRDWPELNPKNSFYRFVDQSVIDERPELVEAALDPDLIAIASDYFGAVPRLHLINVWISPPPENGYTGSHLYHLDKGHKGILSLFILLEDVGPEDGPFCFLPKDVSERVCRKTDYPRVEVLGKGRLSDEQVAQHVSPDEAISVLGKAGSALLIDTSECLHFGSRVQEGHLRKMMVVRFYRAHKELASTRRERFDVVPAEDPVRRLILD